MRLAVFGDIHGNLPAFEAVLKDIERQSPDTLLYLVVVRCLMERAHIEGGSLPSWSLIHSRNIVDSSTMFFHDQRRILPSEAI